MLAMIETFSGIGAQASALKNCGVQFNILNTADWDINAIIAYDLIHNGEQDLKKYINLDREQLLLKLEGKTLSLDGKKPATAKQLHSLDVEVLRRLVAAIERSNNLISVTDIDGTTLPNEMNMLTYSFPCQDLSLAGNWHGNRGGIDRNANNRSSMLWQVERILLDRFNANISLPNFLLMENVRSIMSHTHIDNFNEWCRSLENMGYINFPLELDARNFGIPQKRVRVFMLSFYVGNNVNLKQNIEKYMKTHDLTNIDYVKNLKISKRRVKDIIKTNYEDVRYKYEADISQPNDTLSRRDIFEKNLKIYMNGEILTDVLPTLTTKQDRHPNSGIIEYESNPKKSKFRYLTPREGFLLMGFEEKDFDRIIDNNFCVNGRPFFTRDKLNKMAGNSIVVNILEQIFILFDDIDNLFY